MERGCGCGKRAASHILLTLMVTATVTVAVYGLRKDDEPFPYKNVANPAQQMYPSDARAMDSSSGSEMKMLLGMGIKDRQILMKSLPSPSMASTIQNDTHNVQDTIENMVEVMEMEESKTSKDKMLPILKKMVDSANSTVNLRMEMAPQTSKQTFQDIVLKFLAISGIEAVLPLDCGKHPRKPKDPLSGRESHPWVAALGSYEDGRFIYQCVGVLISQYHILTDADCASSPKINVVMMNVTDTPDPGVVLNFVAGRRVHPAIKDEEDLLSGNNIGILELALPYMFNDYIQPICLAGQFEEPDPFETSEVTIVGFHMKDFPTGQRISLYNWYNSTARGSGFCFVILKDIKRNNPEIKTTLEDIITKKHLCVFRDFELVGKSVILKVHEKTGRVRVVGLGGVANAATTSPIAYTLVQPHRFWVELVLKKFQDNIRPRMPATISPDAELSS